MLVELTIGESIRRARKKKGISSRELSMKTGYDPTCVSKWENDKAVPKITSMIDIADALGISIDELVGHEVKGGGT